MNHLSGYTSKKLTILAILLLILLSACTAPASESQPPDIAYGQDLCDQCGMVIGEARFAAAILLSSGKYLKFDDIGEMLAYFKANPEIQVEAWFVHDYTSEEWVRGEKAFFVRSSSLQTPMGTGIVAFKDRAEADRFAAENSGVVFNLEEILAMAVKPKPMHKP